MDAITGLSGSTTINAPKAIVWSILDDFPNIADWTSQVKTSVQLGDKATGVGGGRHCELAPFGAIDEEIIEYVPGEKMVIEVSNMKKLPMKSSTTTFTVNEIDEHTTEVTMAPTPVPKGGPMQGMVAKRIEKSMPKAIAGLLDDLKVAAEAKVDAAA